MLQRWASGVWRHTHLTVRSLAPATARALCTTSMQPPPLLKPKYSATISLVEVIYKLQHGNDVKDTDIQAAIEGCRRTGLLSPFHQLLEHLKSSRYPMSPRTAGAILWTLAGLLQHERQRNIAGLPQPLVLCGC